jgi:hypothetical protein
MRWSIEAVVGACSMTTTALAWVDNPAAPEAAPFAAALAKSKWLHHVRRLLDGATLIVDLMSSRGESVLVHCSDG